MAKSSRAHRVQKNNTALRAKVFAPAEQARNERLNQKLMEIVSKPSEREQAKENEMEVETTQADAENAKRVGDEMQIDDDGAGKVVHKHSDRKTPSRFQKKRRGKPHSQIVFPQLKKRKQMKEMKQKQKRAKK